MKPSAVVGDDDDGSVFSNRRDQRFARLGSVWMNMSAVSSPLARW